MSLPKSKIILIIFSFLLLFLILNSEFFTPQVSAAGWIFGTDPQDATRFVIKDKDTGNVKFRIDSSGAITQATINASNISSGAFGANTGGGNFNFPGNVGIGTTGPQTMLDVTGFIRAGSGFRFPDGTTMTTAASGSVTGNGTQNYLPKWNTTGTGLIDSQVFDNGTNIGIGTAGPATKLDIIGSGTGQLSLLRIQNSHGWTNDTAGIAFSTFSTLGDDSGRISSKRTDRAVSRDSDLIFETYTNNALVEKMRIMDNGNVGIGTALPQGKLDLSGSYATGSLSGSNHLMFSSGGSTPDAAQVVWGDNTGWKLHFGTQSVGTFTPRMTIIDTGNVGIGTTIPAQKLSVAGVVESTTGGFKFPDGSTQSSAVSGVPSGAVMSFNLSSCPSGWTEFTGARGRTIVGLPASGSLAGSVGTALTNLEDRTHTHNVTGVEAHTHPFSGTTDAQGNHNHWFDTSSYAGGTGRIFQTSECCAGAFYTSSSGSHAHNFSGTTGSTGGGYSVSSAGRELPYIQLLVCQKN